MGFGMWILGFERDRLGLRSVVLDFGAWWVMRGHGGLCLGIGGGVLSLGGLILN